MQDIHDIRPPVMVGMDPELLRTLVWAAGAVVLAVLAFVAIRLYLKYRKKKPEQPVAVVIPAYKAACNALARLENQPFQDAKNFYFDLGRVLKAYVGESLGFNCLEMTTQEIGRYLKEIGNLPGSIRSDITKFQDLCDPFRYAPVAPDKARIRQDLNRARTLIDTMEQQISAALQQQEKCQEDA